MQLHFIYCNSAYIYFPVFSSEKDLRVYEQAPINVQAHERVD